MAKGDLIYCPRCEKIGKKEILGAMYNGRFTVLRFHRGETIIESEQFDVYCGVCGEQVFYRTNLKEIKNEEQNSPDNRSERIYREALIGSVIV